MSKRDPITLPKRYLTYQEAAWCYGTTVDYLESVPADELPRNRRGHRTVLFDVADLEAHFARLRVGGDERKGETRETPTTLPVHATVTATAKVA
jgi:hypothetical protein